MMRIIKFIIALAVVGCLAIAAIFCWSLLDKRDDDKIDVSRGVVNDVRTMVNLCAIDLYNEVPVRDTINKKEIFAVQKQRGSISFDMENLQVDFEGDTLRIVLPPEIIEINEATEDNSWQVIDTKNIGFLGMLRSDRLNENEEKQVKAKVKLKSKRLLYLNGTVKRARAEGADNIRNLMEKVYRKPVEVIDPTPNGAHYQEYVKRR